MIDHSSLTLRERAEQIAAKFTRKGSSTHMEAVETVHLALRAVQDAERARWQPIASAPKDGTVILRPHRIWGAMDVRYITAEDAAKVSTLARDIPWCWMNGDYTTAWTDSAFLPFWMPLPAPPAIEEATDV